jgi:hypothetical protein
MPPAGLTLPAMGEQEDRRTFRGGLGRLGHQSCPRAREWLERLADDLDATRQ